MPDFVHLHTHSHYSLLDGLIKIDELLDKAREYNMKALALTDHGVMYGVVEFYQKAKERGIKPIIGVEAYLARNSLQDKRPKIDEKPYHIVLLAKNKVGYLNLIKITSKAYLEGFYYKPRIDLEFLADHAKGLIGLTSCLQGEIPLSIINNDLAKTEKLILKYNEIFGQNNFYLEVQDHPNLRYQTKVNEEMIQLGKKLKIPVVATNDVHYLNSEDAEAHDILLCLQTKHKQKESKRLSYMGEDYSFKSPQIMTEHFKDHPEVIENTNKVAELCNFELELGQVTLPYFETPHNLDKDQYLRQLCKEGLKKRYDSQEKIDPEILKRLDYELSIIQKTGFASYFLIVQDFINWAKKEGIVVGPGRGSAAGSIVSYLTNITNIDPIKYNLLFERFLNPERISMPDIDMDFADKRRDEVIQYVERKYGKDHVAQIITFGTMAARAVIRDVGRVLGLTYTYCDKIAKLIPTFTTLDQALNIVPELKEIYESDPEIKKLIEIAKKLEGVARHVSTHACGVVITKESLDQRVPVQYASQDDKIIITQYSLHPIEDLGLLKMDFLGLKNLTIIEDTLKIIQKTKKIEISIDNIPLDDPKTFKLLQKVDTTGVFQLESTGMKRYLRQLNPTTLEDIIAMVALYRPGPMDWIPNFIAGKHKKKVTKYLHPSLKSILEKTYGVAIYQEQVMQIAQELAGFTLGEADVLRKAVGKKIPKLLKQQKEKFIQGCLKNNIQKEIAEKIFDFIEPFAGYGFNRAHAACYALIAYQTAYLKANFPTQFMASLLTSDYGDTDRVAIEVAECEQMGIEVLPPDINESYSTFTVVKESLEEDQKPRIRFGLTAIKNVGTSIVNAIIEERKQNGNYENLEDFLRRVQTKDLNKKSLESLIKSGALDKFGERNQMLYNMEKLLTYAKTAQKEKTNGQTNLFGMLPLAHLPSLRLEETEPTSKQQRIAWEKGFLGLYISEHPLDEYKEYFAKNTIPCREIGEYLGRSRVRIGGVITQIQKILTRNQEPMLFIKVEDTSGEIEILVFPSTLKTNPEIWQEDKIVIVDGRISDKDGLIKLICNEAYEFNPKNPPHSFKPLAKTQKISISNQSTGIIYLTLPPSIKRRILERLKIILNSNPGSYQVNLLFSKNNQTKKIATNFLIDYNEKIAKEIEILIGQNSIKIDRKT